MELILKCTRLKTILPVMILVTITLGCLCMPVGILPTPRSPTVPATHTISPTPIPSPNVPPAVQSTLNAVGPWLLIESDQGLWAANSDGSGLSLLTAEDFWNYALPSALQPGGSLVAFLTPAGYDFHHMALNLLSLPDGTVMKVTDLTSPETEGYADSAPGDDGFEALRAVQDEHNLAWSPDGSRLAFVGFMDGPSAEIYVYEIASGEIRRVSHDDYQNYWPSWSPDGNTLLYFGAQAFGSGAGFNTSGVWSARAEDLDVTWLYTPGDGNEELVGWVDDHTAVMDTWTPGAGSAQLRLFDVITTETTTVYEGPILGAKAEPWFGNVIFATSSGLYLHRLGGTGSDLLSGEEVARIDPMEPGEYYFTVYFTDGSLSTYGDSDFDSQISPVRVGGRLEVAMYGWIWGWTSEDESQPGAWITGPGIEIGRIFEQAARLPIWDEDNNLLFFSPAEGGGYDLYRTTFDGYYQDLSAAAFINAGVRAVSWLGAP